MRTWRLFLCLIISAIFLESCDKNAVEYGCRYSIQNFTEMNIRYLVFRKGELEHENTIIVNEKFIAAELYVTFHDVSSFSDCSYDYADSIVILNDSNNEKITSYYNPEFDSLNIIEGPNMFFEDDHLLIDYKPQSKGEVGLKEYLFILN